MRHLFRSARTSLRTALTKRPSPEDAASVVSNTTMGASFTALNAVIYAIGAYEPEALFFLASWLACVFLICAALARLSGKVAARPVEEISPRRARKLVWTSALLALPWAILPVYVMGLHGAGQPLIVLLVSAGMMSGGAFMLHRTFLAALAYMATILAPLIVSVHAGGWDQAWSVTAYSLVYSVFLAFVAYAAGETARQRDESVKALSNAVERLRLARDENHLLANIDHTTGLLNRNAFTGRLRAAADRFEAGEGGFGLLLMDLDRFKNVNDIFGHGVGDELLAEIGRRLQANLSDHDVIGRLGGDEFAIILPDLHDDKAIMAFADKLLGDLDKPARLAGRHVHPAASIGAVLCPDDATDPVDLLLRADLALNRAKETGRGQCLKFDDRIRRQVVDDDEIEAGLRRALEEDELDVFYQPKISLADGRLLGAEALVRWLRPDGRSISPERFLSIAAERSLLPNVSARIAETVASDILSWRRSALAHGKIALNIHPDDIKSPELFMETIRAFEAKGIDGRDLVLEVTEGCIFGRGTDAVSLLLDALADRGYELSLDDFGTGHASLSHLKTIPVAEIKIDRSFVSGIEARPDDRAVVAAIAEIARGMGIRSVGEGVENEAQRAILADLGVDVGQGYLWSKPMSAGDFAKFLTQDSIREAS